jgi:SagB-type dehydrogenase family enzyme
MVAESLTGRGLLRELDGHDVDGDGSRVRPVSCPVDPMRRHVRPARAFASRDDRVAARLQDLQGLLEWAYGFRAPPGARQRPTRRAPSAGALYPTETFVVVETEQGWQVLYYDYAGHRFYQAAGADAGAMAQSLALNQGDVAILFASVLWRTVQRYGVRGYRYCLLDAAHVAGNLARAARAFGRVVELDPLGPTAELEQLLGLDHGEALLLTARVPLGPGPVLMPPGAAGVLPPQGATVEQPPLFSPVLRRATAFHRRTLTGPSTAAAVAWTGRGDTSEELHRWAVGRNSARDFTGASVTAEQYARLAAVAVGSGPVFRHIAPPLRVYSITARVQGLAIGVGPLGAETDPSWEIPGQTAAGLAQALTTVCQNQAIMKSSAFAFVLAARKDELAQYGHAGYRALVLNAGFLCADLYREAARLELGTTSIGGFSDEGVARMLGDASLVPVVIQAFGVPARSAEKVDAARIVGRPWGREGGTRS